MRALTTTSLALLGAACSTADYVADADQQVYGILERASLAVTGDTKTFPIGRDRFTLRDELLANPPERLHLSLLEALDIASRASRTFQNQKEALYLSALALTGVERNFEFRPAAGGDAAIDGVGDDTASTALGSDLSAAANSTSGGRIVASFVSTFFRSLVNGGGFDSDSLLNLTITQPLLRGAGVRIAREPLTQAERNVIYAVRSFERFRKTLAVDVSSLYYTVARQVADLESEEINYQLVRGSREQIEALFNAGRRNVNDVDLAAQNELAAENRLINARIGLQTALDNFKLTLGLPITCELEIDVAELKRLKAIGVTGIDLREADAIDIALERRFDFRTALDEVVDATRRIRVTEDALSSMLDFSAAFSIPTDPDSPLDFDWTQIDWSAGFDLDLALDRLDERNAHRSALIGLDVEMRNRDQLEDQIRTDVRNSMRNIRSRIESYDIQARAVTLAERRIDSTSELYDAGRASARDILEAQEALLGARLGLSASLVDYAVARLELMLDLEAIAIEPKGLRYDRTLPIPERQATRAQGTNP